MDNRRRPRSRGFTLVELLVVITIVILVSAVTLPAVLPALNHRQVDEAARILQGALVGARDAAIRANKPRGIRLYPDPTLTSPAIGTTTTLSGVKVNLAGTNMLAYNRVVPIEPAPDYHEGFVSIEPPHPFPPGYNFRVPYPNDPTGMSFYPYNPGGTGNNVLMIEECPLFQDNPLFGPNPPVSWFWNVRVGDKIRLDTSGRFYTVVGPLTIHPRHPTTYTGQNPELFVNVGPPGTASPLRRNYLDPAGNPIFTSEPEFLFLVNGEDDNGNGYVDEGWNGMDDWNNMSNPPDYSFNFYNDEVTEWEKEKWLGARENSGQVVNEPYTLIRRPLPTQGAREVTLPAGAVIDATSWRFYTTANGLVETQQERSRLPIDEKTLYVDIMLDPNGQVVPTSEYSSVASLANGPPYYHFWLTEREGMHEISEMGGVSASGLPVLNTPMLPMPSGTAGYTSSVLLKGERRLLTLFTRSGLVTVNPLETFDVKDVNAPFFDAQQGRRGSD